ncbi:MAG: hypothetical protein HC784_01495 [Hydrococcus sp. CSU_1_8]|nr:hypothetical protein [Hydrococcus sp. CSU_1_8]
MKTTLKTNINKDIQWFLKELIDSRNTIDYTFGKSKKTDNNILIPIINKTNVNIPVPVYGLKNNEIVFKKWLTNIKKDTVLSFKKNEISGCHNFFPHFVTSYFTF